MCNNGFGGGNICWIIILILLFCNGGMCGCDTGCQCQRDTNCCC